MISNTDVVGPNKSLIRNDRLLQRVSFITSEYQADTQHSLPPPQCIVVSIQLSPSLTFKALTTLHAFITTHYGRTTRASLSTGPEFARAEDIS